MNSEEQRFRSFSSWPANAPVYPRHLAFHGFFATGRFPEAKCHWCNCCISNWEYGDLVDQRHLSASPHCDFITNYERCGNIPMSTGRMRGTELRQSSPSPCHSNATDTSATERQEVDLTIETNRLATFKNWPNPNISPQSLAKAGFFYLNKSDEVKCAWCKGVIAQWEKQDNAFDEHKRFFPECPRVQLGPLIEITSDGIRDLGIHHISPPKNPEYSSIDSRLRTYTNWPITDVQKPEALAQAGLYYQGVDDHVRCFHCNMGLRSWEKDDDPWFEHAKWFPICQFVCLVKGSKYIKDVQESMKNQEMDTKVSSSNIPIEAAMNIDQAMTTAPVLIALEIGLDVGSVRNKTLQQIMRTGYPYSTAEDLLKAVLDEPENVDIVNLSADHSLHSIDSERASTSATPANTELNNTNPEHKFNPGAANEFKNENGNGTSNTTGLLKVSTNESSNPCSSNKESLTKDQLSLEEENRKLKDARLCKVCLDNEVGVVYLPCGHLVACVQCAPSVSQCPMCRTTIKGFVRTFLS